ncbi:MAG: sigma-54-dependent Fis family transcriptional regulator [Bryobacterales bacterium]|nr:sigma-54-dependent Fis family transcriptional regulator [Bryobacterales bacterium]
MEYPQSRILVVDDECEQRDRVGALLESWGYATLKATNGSEALGLLDSEQVDVVVTDLMMPVMTGLELLRSLHERGSAPPVIALTAFGGIEKALSVIHDYGAFWFAEKPVQPEVLRALVERAVTQVRLAEENHRLRLQLSQQGVLDELIGNSDPMKRLFATIRQIAPTRASVLLTGESGSGKELVARAIHKLSPRTKQPFIAVNCAALPETLIESELFGHEKGSFTGAVERRVGCMEAADGGTLLLDELAEMPIQTQGKLLRVLEDRRVRRLGGRTDFDVDVRVIAATNRNALDAIRDGRLREDLYYRLNVFHLALPALRERKEDLPLLADAFVQRYNLQHGCKVSGLHPSTLERLYSHNWPGNVRELRNVIEYCVVMTGEGLIYPKSLPAHIGDGGAPTIEVSGESETVTLPFGTSVEKAEEALIRLTLQHTNNNKTRAALILGLSTKTLLAKLRQYHKGHSMAADGR